MLFLRGCHQNLELGPLLLCQASWTFHTSSRRTHCLCVCPSGHPYGSHNHKDSCANKRLPLKARLPQVMRCVASRDQRENTRHVKKLVSGSDFDHRFIPRGKRMTRGHVLSSNKQLLDVAQFFDGLPQLAKLHVLPTAFGAQQLNVWLWCRSEPSRPLDVGLPCYCSQASNQDLTMNVPPNIGASFVFSRLAGCFSVSMTAVCSVPDRVRSTLQQVTLVLSLL